MTRRGPNPQARKEHRDLLTGKRVRPSSAGSLETGRYVMRMRPAPGEPFEDVVVDREDLDPSKDTFGVARETFPRYRQIAAQKAKAKARELKRMPTFERDAPLRVPGARATFTSPKDAVEQFLSHNPSLWDLGWADAGDHIEDWMDGIEVKQRRGHKSLDETPRGRELMDLFRAGRNDQGMRETLAFMFGQAKGNRWEDVAWDQVHDLVEIFAENARREADRTGSTRFLVAGIPRIDWMPPATGFAEPTAAFIESLDDKGRAYYRRWKASEDLHGIAQSLESALSRNKKCLTAEERKVVRSRIKTIREWAKRPDTMPEWACASFREPAVLCDLLGIEREVSKLSAACDLGYDPAWAIHERDGVQPGLGLVPEAERVIGKDGPGPEDLDLPWETAANPASLRERLKRR